MRGRTRFGTQERSEGKDQKMSELLFISLASVFLLLSEPCRNSFLSDLPFSFSSLCVVIMLFHLPKWRSSSILSRPDGWRRWRRGKEHLFSMRCFKKTKPCLLESPVFFLCLSCALLWSCSLPTTRSTMTRRRGESPLLYVSACLHRRWAMVQNTHRKEKEWKFARDDIAIKPRFTSVRSNCGPLESQWLLEKWSAKE